MVRLPPTNKYNCVIFRDVSTTLFQDCEVSKDKKCILDISYLILFGFGICLTYLWSVLSAVNYCLTCGVKGNFKVWRPISLTFHQIRDHLMAACRPSQTISSTMDGLDESTCHASQCGVYIFMFENWNELKWWKWFIYFSVEVFINDILEDRIFICWNKQYGFACIWWWLV